MTGDGKPTFVGSPEETALAAQVFDLMLFEGRSYSTDAPIRRSLRDLSVFVHSQGTGKNPDDVEKLLDNVLRKNAAVFYREESDGAVYYVTSKKGSYRPQSRTGGGYRLPSLTSRHMGTAPQTGGATGMAKPTLIRREMPTITAERLPSKPTTRETVREAAREAVKESPLRGARSMPFVEEPMLPPEPVVEPPPPPPPPPVVVKPVPQIAIPQGPVVNMSKSPQEILAEHREYFTDVLRERLAADGRFVSFGNEWFLSEQMTPMARGEVRQVRDFLDANGGPDTVDNISTNVFRKAPDSPDYSTFRFTLNHRLAGEKKTFEFVGTANQQLWWIAGTPSPRILRAPLKPTEVGQDLKYLEDEPPAEAMPEGKWEHVLTFYEWENGILPYSPEAKLLFPAPLLRDQKNAQLRFEAPQFDASAVGELHYPSGNRGGWIEGLGEILAVFVSGARLTISTKPEAPDTYLITFQQRPVQEHTVLLYDEKRQRFVFEGLPLTYDIDEDWLLERNRFKSLKDVRRLDEQNRRRGDPVLIFAFEKIGAKTTQDGKTVYRARWQDLLPIINIEKPFSLLSFQRFVITHPHYRKDETEEGYYLYVPDRD